MGWEGQKDGFAEIKMEKHAAEYTTIGVRMPTRLIPPTKIEAKVKINQPSVALSQTISESVKVTSP